MLTISQIFSNVSVSPKERINLGTSEPLLVSGRWVTELIFFVITFFFRVPLGNSEFISKRKFIHPSHLLIMDIGVK